MTNHTFELTSEPANIEPLQQELQTILQALDMRPKLIYAVNLALGEWLENVIHHAYPEGGEHPIQVQCAVSECEAAITVRDSGRPFNPLEFPLLDTALATPGRLSAGQGIHLIRKLMDEVTYERREERNVLTMRKSFENRS
jgi:serine/threonine-protein kinase RsbW